MVTASRPAAVKYKMAFEKYIREHGYSDMACFVAFSGKVKLDEEQNKEYTEMGMNGISEKKLPEAFDKDENRILIVANKYQTGFDQPRLCAMYVLKKLKKISAVQTLSRLNRICPPYEKKTFVLDFCNTYKDIKKSFAPYYTATRLENDITPSDIFKLEAKLDGFGVLDEYDIDNFAELITIAQPTDRQKIQMTGYLRKAEDRANKLPEEDKKEFVANLKRFVRFYEFVIMASHLEDVELHKKYKFCSNLQSWFKKDLSGDGFSLKNQIVANNFLNKLQGEYQKPNLVANPYVKLPEAETQLSEDEEKKLSEIIEEINNRTGNKFDKDVAAKAMLQIKEILLKSDKLQQSALVNTQNQFKFSFYDEIDDALVKGLEQNQDFFSLLLSNPEMKKQVLGIFVNEVYKTLKNRDNSAVIPLYEEYKEGFVPLYTLHAACGYFEDGEEPEKEGWVDARGKGFTPDPKRHFAVHAKGDSMLPKIKDGDICVFEWYRAGSRNGEIVLTQSNEFDSDYGGKYTIKRYHSEKTITDEDWKHTKIKLIPLNKDYNVIELDSDTEYRTIGVLKCIL